MHMQPDFNKVWLDEISDAVIAKTPEGRVIYWSQGDQDIFGYTRDEAVGRLVGELIIPADRMEEESGILEGTSPGLAFARQIIELQGGTIGVESEVGRGSIFGVILPAERGELKP
jgi:PAS domain S-box-containing protein